MKHIKNVGELFVLDWKRIVKNPVAIFLIIALMIVPSLYAWFNIKALWDPYANTSQLPIAVYSDDQTGTFQKVSINIGKEVTDELESNKELGWTFVTSKAELDQGVRSGKYYAGIYLPKDFSKDLLSFTTGEIKKPKIIYSSNEKINAIAPKITSKGASTLQSQITEEFIKTASSTLMETFNKIGYDVDKNLVSLQKVRNAILSTNNHLSTIDQYSQEVLNLQGKIPELKNKLAKANEVVTYLPEVDQLGKKVIDLNQKMPDFKEKLSLVLTLQDKLPEIKNAGKQLAALDQNFSSIEKTMQEGIQEAKQGLEIINQVQTALPDIHKLSHQADDFATQTLSAAQKFQDALPSITSSIKITLQSVQLFAKNTSSILSVVNQAISDGQLTNEEKQQIDALTQDFEKSIVEQQTSIQNMISFMQQTQEETGSHDLDATIAQITTLSQLLGKLSEEMNALNTLVQSGAMEQIKPYLNEIQATVEHISGLIEQIKVDKISADVNRLLETLVATITQAQGLLDKAQQIDFEALLSSTSQTVAGAIVLLEQYQGEMPAVRQEIHDANLILNGNMDRIISSIQQGADFYQNEFPLVQEKIGLAAQFFQKDYPGVREELTNTLGTLNQKMPDVEKALNDASDLIVKDWPSIKTGVQKAASAIEKSEKEVDLGALVKLLKLDATKESNFLAQPIEIQENDIYPIANNGSASTPFYTALCLWVGAVLFSSVATTEFYLKDRDKNRFSKREQFFGRMSTFVVMGIAQAVIVTLGNYFALGVDVHHPGFSVLFAVLIAIVFMTMVYVLVALFGNIGKGLAIIILVLSISGGGGNYPIQVSGKFFQTINPYLPFTHAVNLLRESAGGIYWSTAWVALSILIGVSIVFVVLGALLFPHFEERTKKISELAHKSHLFH